LKLINKSILALLFTLIAVLNLQGQKDSLLQAVLAEKDLYLKHRLAGNLYWKHLYNDVEFSDLMTSIAFSTSEQIGSDSIRLVSMQMKANVKLIKTDYDSVLHYINLKESIGNQNSSSLNHATNLALRGLVSYHKGAFNDAIEYNFKALEIHRIHNNHQRQMKLLSNIGNNYERLGDYEEAIKFYEESLTLTAPKDSYSLAATYSNLGAAQINSNLIGAAEKSYEKAKLLMVNVDNDALLNDVDNGFARIFKKNGDFQASLLIANQIYKRAREKGDTFREVRMLELIGSLKLELGKYKTAIQDFENALRLGEEYNVGESRLETFKNLKKAFLGVGQFDQALIAQDSVLSLQSRLFNKEKLSITKDLNLKYETAINEQKLQASIADNERKTSQRNVAFASILAMLAFGAFFYQRMKSKELNQQKLELIQQKKIENLENERKILSISAMLEGQEKERFRIARDLHDGLGSLLSSVKAHFSNIENEIKQLEKISVFEKAQKMMDNAVEEVRRISQNLMPPILTTQGLPNALRNLVADFGITNNLEISIDIQKMEERLEINKEIVLYRVSQELLNNIRKHSKAKNVEINLYGLDKNVQLIVEDDGIGFDSSKSSKGIGLISLRSRVELLGGHLELDTAINEGTTVSISIPR